MKTEGIKCPWSLVAVHWMDAFDGENGWTDTDKYDPAATTVVTVGFLWPECLRGYLTLVSSYMPDEVPDLKTTSGPVHIPLGMVLTVTMLEQPEIDLEKVLRESSQTPDEPSEESQQTQEKSHSESSLPQVRQPRWADGNETNRHGHIGSPFRKAWGSNREWLQDRPPRRT